MTFTTRWTASASRLHALVFALVTLTASSVQAQSSPGGVDYNVANDYYAAIATGRHKVVEQYHLGPCESALVGRNYRKALSECDFILKIFPNHPTALLLVVRTCEQWKAPNCNAGEYIERGIAINPKAAPTYVIQGIYFHGAKQYAKAREAYDLALKIEDKSVNAHYNLGLTCLELKDYACANEHAQKAYALGATVPGLRDKLQKAGQWKPA